MTPNNMIGWLFAILIAVALVVIIILLVHQVH